MKRKEEETEERGPGRVKEPPEEEEEVDLTGQNIKRGGDGIAGGPAQLADPPLPHPIRDKARWPKQTNWAATIRLHPPYPFPPVCLYKSIKSKTSSAPPDQPPLPSLSLLLLIRLINVPPCHCPALLPLPADRTFLSTGQHLPPWLCVGRT